MTAKEFLQKLLDDPKFQEDFAKDPEAVMAREGLPDDARQAIRKGDLKALAQAAGLYPSGIQKSSLVAPWPWP